MYEVDNRNTRGDEHDDRKYIRSSNKITDHMLHIKKKKVLEQLQWQHRSQDVRQR